MTRGVLNALFVKILHGPPGERDEGARKAEHETLIAVCGVREAAGEIGISSRREGSAQFCSIGAKISWA